MTDAPWTRLLNELRRLAPSATAGVGIDPDEGTLRLSLRQAVSAGPHVCLRADVAMSFAEAEQLAEALSHLGVRGGRFRAELANDAAAWIRASDGPLLELVGMVALIRSLMRLGADAHGG